MKFAVSVIRGILAATVSLPVATLGQATEKGEVHNLRPTTPSMTFPGRLGAKTDNNSAPIDYPVPQITVMAPPQPQAQWPLHDRISWIANLVLALSGYTGIWIALSTLKKIERQTKLVEDAVSSTASTARTALLQVEAVIRAERPWIMVTAEPSPDTAGSSIVVATNRGKGPAKIVSMADKILRAADECHLPSDSDVEVEKKSGAMQSLVLLPGESTVIRMFGREDVERFCVTEKALKRVEDWEEKVFLAGKVVYKGLNTADEGPMHETSWVCWYIYGQKKSGLVTIGHPGLTALT